MSCIGSNNNRHYAGKESAYGIVPVATSSARVQAVRLGIRQELERARRRDKTGTRTFQGEPEGLRQRTTFDLEAYLTTSGVAGVAPALGTLVEAALGGTPRLFGGITVASSSGPRTIATEGAHGLTPGQAVSFGNEIRFVIATPEANLLVLHSPFTIMPGAGAPLGSTITYGTAEALPSVSLFDHWSPATAVQRIARGAGVGRMTVTVNGDYHTFRFEGPAADVLDSASFEEGQGGLSQFPAEPAANGAAQTPVPGHLGQVWMGADATLFSTLTAARLRVDNNLDVRAREFGSRYPVCLAAGEREVALSFSLLGRDDAATKALYQAARQRSPIGVTIQLGQRSGQLCGLYLKSVVPEVPEFDDGETRLVWEFGDSRAQGISNDDLYIAFG
jgi:hypothetical protein